jgi:hypothetical protein
MKKRLLILILLPIILTGCKISHSEKKIIEHEYYCEEGQTMVSDHCEGLVSVDPVSITCDPDFPFNETSRKCERVLTIPVPKDYYCDPGFELRNGKCINDETGEVRYRNARPECRGGVPNGIDKCDLIDQREAVFVCEEGYTPNQLKVKCEKIGISEIQERIIER